MSCRRTYSRAAGLLTLLWISLSAPLAQADNRNVDRYFGLHMHRIVKPQPWLPNGARLTPWPAVPFGSWRLWDSYVSWMHLEPKPEQWSFELLDQYVARAEKEGVELLLPLALTPRWASARPDEESGYGPGHAAEPKDFALWRRYVRTVATRYKGRIKAYEVWNEINAREFYTGSVENMIELARIAHEAIKDADPDALVLSPSVTGGGVQLKWLERYLGQGGGRYADVIAHHFYVPWGPPEEMLPLIRSVKEIMERTGNGTKPLWNTETGWWQANGDGTPDHPTMAKRKWKKLAVEVEGPAYLARALILGKAYGLSRFYWYAWDNLYGYGLMEPETGAAKPAANAFGRVVEWLSRGDSVDCNYLTKIWRCTVRSSGEARVLVVWTDSGARLSVNLGQEWSRTSTELLNGGALAFGASDPVTVDGTPVAFFRH